MSTYRPSARGRLGILLLTLLVSFPAAPVAHSTAQVPAAFPRLHILPRLAPGAAPTYDEQLGISFTQDFASLAYRVTAVAQNGSGGFGPGYLLNGFASTGYWYQVGLSWNWGGSNPASGYTPGFNLIYEVFAPNGTSIFPVDGGGGIAPFSGRVNPRDSVLLGLNFSSGQVVMLAVDQNTGAQASEMFSAEGATVFVGTPASPSASPGYFTGLMTEWYHTDPYFGDEQQVTYTSAGTPISSAWMWIDEFGVQNGTQTKTVFAASTPSPVTYSAPTQLVQFSSNGATEESGPTQFITGTVSTVTLTLSYRVLGEGSGYSPPVLTYTLNGTQHSALVQSSPTVYSIDVNSSWRVMSALSGSSLDERWVSSQQTNGTATVSQTVSITYYHQYSVGFSFSAIGGAVPFTPRVTISVFGSQRTVIANATGWADASGRYEFQNPLNGTTPGERWYASSGSGIVSSTRVSTTYYRQENLTVGYSIVGGGSPRPPDLTSYSLGLPVSVTLNGVPASVWLDAGAAYHLTNPLGGSTSSERWSTSSSGGNVSQAGVILPAYYHQFGARFGYSVSGGGVGYAPANVTFATFGSLGTRNANVTVWLDSGSPYSYPDELATNAPSRGERWHARGAVNGTIQGLQTVDVTYVHEYYLQVSAVPPVGGQVANSSAWHPAGERVNVSAEPSAGWQLHGWEGEGAGSYSGEAADFGITMDAPTVENATFYPGLTLHSSADGTITYSLGSVTGVVQAGSSKTIYQPMGTVVSLAASPVSPIYAFTGWGGNASGISNRATVVLDGPRSVSGQFGFNLGTVAAILVAAVAVVVVSIWRIGRRGRLRVASEPSGSDGTTMRWNPVILKLPQQSTNCLVRRAGPG